MHINRDLVILEFEERKIVKGYQIEFGYMGYVPNLDKFLLFSTEDDYKEWYSEYLRNKKEKEKKEMEGMTYDI